MPQDVLDDGDGNTPFKELGGSGVSQNVWMGKVPGDAGFLRPLIKHSPKIPLVYLEDLSLLARKIHQVVGYLARDERRDRYAPYRLLGRFLLEGSDLELAVAPVDLCQVIDELHLT